MIRAFHLSMGRQSIRPYVDVRTMSLPDRLKALTVDRPKRGPAKWRQSLKYHRMVTQRSYLGNFKGVARDFA
jgi:hypothetical protein